MNARIRHFITRSHANGMTRLPCRYAHENNWFWNTVELCFSNTLDFFFFFNTLSSFVSVTRKLILYTPEFVSFLIVRMVFVKYIAYRIWAKIKKIFFPIRKLWQKKGTFTANHGSFPHDFHKEFNEHDVFHKVQRSSVWTHELLFQSLILTF